MKTSKTANNELNETGKLIKICTCGAYKIAKQKPEQTNITFVKNPKKECTCGAYVIAKPKLADGMHRIKVQHKYVESGPVSSLVLTGRWMEALGFVTQKYVLVKAELKRLVIEVED